MLVHWIVDTVTGQKDIMVQPTDGEANRSLVDVGDGRHTFMVQGSKIPREHWWDLLKTDWSRTLVIAWQDPDDESHEIPLYAGQIIDADPNDDGTVTVQHCEVGAFWDARLPFTEYDPDGSFTVLGRSYRGQVLQTLVRAIQGPRRDLPLQFSAYDESGPHDLIVPNYDMKTIAEIITDIRNTDGGPDVNLKPVWDYESRLKHDVLVGDLTATAPLLEFNITAPKPGQVDFRARTSGAKRASSVWAAGQGSEVTMRVGHAELGGSSPALERVRSFKDESDVNRLNALALGEANAFAGDSKQPTLTVPLDDAMRQGFELGSHARLLTENHWWYPDVPQVYDIIGFTIGANPDEIEFKIGAV